MIVTPAMYALFSERSMTAGAHRPRSPRGARRRSCSQNFLASRTLAAQLVREANVGRGDLVVEIGAGGGILTAELARRAGRVLAIEIDAVWAARLRQRFAQRRNVEVNRGRCASCTPS